MRDSIAPVPHPRIHFKYCIYRYSTGTVCTVPGTGTVLTGTPSEKLAVSATDHLQHNHFSGIRIARWSATSLQL
jgi:hypothetical protein